MKGLRNHMVFKRVDKVPVTSKGFRACSSVFLVTVIVVLFCFSGCRQTKSEADVYDVLRSVKEQKYVDAELQFLRLDEAQRSTPLGKLAEGEITWWRSEFSHAEALFKEARDDLVGEDAGRALQDLSFYYLYRGEYERAEQYANDALDADSHLVGAHMAKANSLARRDEWTRASAELKKAVELDPSLAGGLQHTIELYEKLGSTDTFKIVDGGSSSVQMRISEVLPPTVEMEFGSARLPMIPVSIDSFDLVVGADMAGMVGYQELAKLPSSQEGTGPTEGLIPLAKLGTLVIENLKATALDLDFYYEMMGEKVGLLGVGVFESKTVRLDFEKGVLVVGPRQALDDNKHVRVLRFFRNSRGDIFIPVEVDGKEIYMLLDIGETKSFFSECYVLDDFPSGQTKESSSTYYRNGKAFKMVTYSVDDVMINIGGKKIKLDKVEARDNYDRLGQELGNKVYGSIGLDILKAFKIVEIDNSRNELRLVE